ncbi:calpastatin [Ectopseudomonas mendocina]|nr:calpastatin [Pseudomonas mendocina]
MNDPFDLARFVEAQQRNYQQALDELRAGAKRSHWIWYVFPQLRGLGRSEMAEHYGISGLDEARAYLAHPLLGKRLEDCARALLSHRGRPVRQIMGSPDDLKLRSSMTLFQAAAPQQPLFAEVLQAFYEGEQDAATLQRL